MNIRYKFCPQLKTYDRIGIEWMPYIMFGQTKNFRSKTCNTDCFGLRFGNKTNLKYTNSIFDQTIPNNSQDCIIIGNSTAFGVGSARDETTISSLLTNKTDFNFYNLGGRAYNGFQEIIVYQSLINYLNNIKKIVIFSGLNDLYLFQGIKFNSYSGPFYFNEKFFESMKHGDLNYKRNLIKFFLQPLTSSEIDWSKITKKEIMSYIFNHNFRENFRKNLQLSSKKITLEDIVLRNLKLWSNISKGTNTEVYFFLQPFLGWGKDFSNEEIEICEYIINNKKISTVFKILEKMKNLHQYYKNILINSCKKLEIPFYDCNEFLKQNSKKTDWLFVDRAHMNDDGYMLISEYIKSKI